MDPSFQDLLGRLDRLSGPFREIREGVHKAMLVAELDPEMALTRSRKVLEHLVREVYQRRCHEPPGTRPLENLIQRLVKDGFFPDRLDAYAATVRKLGNVGTHTFGEKITAADVRHSLSQLGPILEWYFEVERPDAVAPLPAGPPPGPAGARPPEPPAAAAPPAAVVPKGLRSFDANDADFFLDLLPGPRDKDGLPESIRFWKHRVESGDEPAFAVGVIYGPSGCGKTSLVKAGLLPRLAGHILAVYVEATADDTEDRLLKGLRKRFPDLPGGLGLTESLAALRQGRGLGAGRKAFLVVDQFEQWLHAHGGEEDAELARALRQCDGERVQCVLLVRDDFWVALSRFMGALRTELVQGQNLALVDLFDLRHARKVLAAFGQAFGALKEPPSKEQELFLDQAVAGLAQDGRVISVRLALFAEMVKGRPWAPAALKAVGGAEGVGVAFLEEAFCSPLASAKNRLHQEAARAVLQALLPEPGADIKGGMRSHGELLEASGYARRPQHFEEVLRILDNEFRLITPTDPEGTAAGGGRPPAAPAARCYQLTHDYLVPSVRAWLTRKRKETRRGRAELRLAERAALWGAKPENRRLPAWWEWLDIRLFTRKKDWTPPQQKMMRRAARYHALQGAALALLLLAAALAALTIRGQFVEENKATHAAGLVRQLLDAETADAPDVVRQLEGYRRWADPLLREAYAAAEAAGREAATEAERSRQARRQLHAGLGLLPVEPGRAEYLYGRLLDAEPQEVAVVRDALLGRKDEFVERLWAAVERPEQGREGRRLRAACALAAYAPDDARWEAASGPVVGQLVSVSPASLGHWMDALRPVRAKLVGPLGDVFRDRKEGRAAERTLATSILADYAADEPGRLADLIQDADDKQFAVLYPRLEAHRDEAAPALRETAGAALEAQPTEDDKERLARRQANAAAALLRLGQPDKAWTLLRHGPDSPDPRARSYLIHRLGPLGVDPAAVVRRLDEEPDVSVRRALLLSLGEFGPDRPGPVQREELIPKLWRLYRDDPDPGLHGAAEWLLRQWDQGEQLRRTNEAWAGDGERTAERLERIRRSLADEGVGAKPQWYVNGQGQTLVVVPGPAEYLMGSPPTEPGRSDDEQLHRQRIGHAFAVAATAVTVGQYLRFDKDYKYLKQYAPTDDYPAHWITWYMAAEYCNWLSREEGLEECYEANGDGKYAEGMRPKPDYLKRTGYRLPTEAEWEHACRAGAATSYYYGESEELLGKYGWYVALSNRQTRARPVANLKPNDLGLFDMHGNVQVWCHERYRDRGPLSSPQDDVEDTSVLSDKESRALRGGSFPYQSWRLRCANRLWLEPTNRGNNVGFRPVRTFR